MAAKSRTVDPALFQKPDFLRATYVAREVWLGMICACADDEGRLEADPWGLSEKLFSRSHDATDEQVAAALQYWQQTGWLILYDNDRYGFLAGWFEHQYIKRESREPSSFPPPPVLINSWRAVEQVKVWHLAERGGAANTFLCTIIRDFMQAVSTDSELSARVLRTDCVDSGNLKIKDKGKEKERESERALLLTAYSDGDRALIEGFLENCADENASKRITPSRAVSEIISLGDLRLRLIGEDEAHGEERWRYGLIQANSHNAPNIRYVEKAARNWRGQNGLSSVASVAPGSSVIADFGVARKRDET